MSWEQLSSILAEARDQAEREQVAPPVDCPVCATPLESGPDGDLHCRWDGWTSSGGVR